MLVLGKHNNFRVNIKTLNTDPTVLCGYKFKQVTKPTVNPDR